MSDENKTPSEPQTVAQGAAKVAAQGGAAPQTANDQAARADPKVLTLLVCPVTKSPLDYDAAAQELISHAAGLAYPIREGVPIMLVDQARHLDVSE